jgi:ElaA protein
MSVTHHSSAAHDIDQIVLYGILKLRVDVFIVEQKCPYPDLDGRDTEPGTRLLWTADETGAVVATIRILNEGESRRIGRVTTAMAARGRGHAATLMRMAVEECEGRRTLLDAQERLEGWYARFGFARAGENFLEDDIVHVPMVRPAETPSAESWAGPRTGQTVAG